jgi:hypothetical protein
MSARSAQDFMVVKAIARKKCPLDYFPLNQEFTLLENTISKKERYRRSSKKPYTQSC